MSTLKKVCGIIRNLSPLQSQPTARVQNKPIKTIKIMARVNFPLTVKELLAECLREVKEGNGDKYVLISNDEEGNGYHECYFSFGPAETVAEVGCDIPYDLKPEKCVILG